MIELKKAALLAFVLVLSSVSIFVESIKPVEASGTIYIRADGSIDPPTANITTSDNVTYTFTDNNYDSIVVERDNIVVDGAGYTIQGTGFTFSRGVYLRYRNNVTIKNVEVTRFDSGIVLSYSHNNTLIGNTITGNIAWMIGGGITLLSSSNNTITNNTISSNYAYGITLSNANNNVLFGNTISSNRDYGIMLGYSSNNTFFHNNFINNGLGQAYTVDLINNVWDNGYPSGGNYWGDDVNVDLYNGLNQNETGSDGIGDTPYVIDENNTDNYPLMGMLHDVPISSIYSGYELEETFHIGIISNSTHVGDGILEPIIHIETGNWMGGNFVFKVTGLEGTKGFSRVTIPKELLWCDSPEQWVIMINGTYIKDEKVMEDPNYTYIYFNYNHTTQNVSVWGVHIIPEFPTWTSMLLILILLTVAVVFYKRRLLKTPIH